jgi:Tol biopolymer transport system component
VPSLRSFVPSLPFLIAASTLACQGDNLTEPSVGTLEVTTSTTGPEPDPDGYTIQVDAGQVLSIGPPGTVRTRNVVGDHTVKLDGVAANCAVASENPRRVTIPAGGTVSVNFSVTCSATTGNPATGSLRVSSSTTGPTPDPDGYLVTVDGSVRGLLGTNGERRVGELALGEHLVGLSRVADNCLVEGNNPRSVTVAAGASATLVFSVICTLMPMIAFTSNGWGLLGIFVVNPDGTGLRQLTPQAAGGEAPVWSPDRSKIAFRWGRELLVMNADGSGRTQLTTGHGTLTDKIRDYRWSPDGSIIAFEADTVEDWRTCCRPQIWLVHADGSGLRLFADGWSPSWSPDGRRIAFNNAHSQILVLNADGTGPKQLTNQPIGAVHPSWSPDGGSIAFEIYADERGRNEIAVMNTDGGDLRNLTQGRGYYDQNPTWSPDGRQIVFQTAERGDDPDFEIGIMNRDGTGRANLTNDPLWSDLGPTWSPDGRKIAFSKVFDDGRGAFHHDIEIYVMNADGSGRINVSNRLDTWDWGPSWSSR